MKRIKKRNVLYRYTKPPHYVSYTDSSFFGNLLLVTRQRVNQFSTFLFERFQIYFVVLEPLGKNFPCIQTITQEVTV